MFLKGFLFIVLIVLSGIALLVCFIFFVVRLSGNHPKKWYWAGGLAVSLAVFLFLLVVFVRKVVHKAAKVGEQMQEQLEKAMKENAVNRGRDFHYELLDSNQTISTLKKFEKLNNHKAPDEFYAYIGFMDYYRMPITYPYSLHCNDVFETAGLFNEENVSAFNISDNGETDLSINGITAIAFDNKLLIVQQKENDEERFLVYTFKEREKSVFKTEGEAFKSARKLNFSGPDTLATILEYYKKFK